MSNRQRFENKVVIVTGAAQGIGRGVALQMAAEGAQVVMVDRSAYVEEVLAEIIQLGGKGVTIHADLETFVGAESVVSKAITCYGRVDILVQSG